MHTFLSIDELLQPNSIYYSGNFFYVNINGINYSFVKDWLVSEPSAFQHSLYTLHKNQPATYILREHQAGKVYIGSSGNIYDRIIAHKGYIKNRTHPNSIFNELLKEATIQDFDLFIIFTATREEAFSIEQLLVDRYKDTGLLINIAYDVRYAMLGATITDEHKEIIRQANLGRAHTDESRRKMSDFHKTDEKAIAQFKEVLSAKRRQVSVDGIEYESITSAALLSPYSESFIRRSLDREDNPNIFYLSDNVSPVKGRTISEEQKQNLSNWRKNNPEARAQLESIRDLVKKKINLNGTVYESVLEACRQNGISEASLRRQIRASGFKTIDGMYLINYTPPKPKAVIIDGIVYESVSIAAEKLSLDKSLIKSRIRNGKIRYHE